jgi:CRISPR/Cas system-associated exonuclease Cas4 (RecB family)
MADMFQSSLFDLIDAGHSRGVPQSRPVKWSYSRRTGFESCLLQYYYRYYGASSRSATGEPLKERLKFLKGVKSIPLRLGEIVHFVLSQHFERLRKNPANSNTGIESWARDMFRKDREASINYQRSGQLPASPYTFLLSEFAHKEENADERWEAANESLGVLIRNFLVSREFEAFRLGGLGDGAIVERKLSISFGLDTASGKIDLAYGSDIGMVIVDWKTGRSTATDDSLQLLSYALVAAHNLNVEPESIKVYKAYLELDSVFEESVSADALLRAKGRIIQDIRRMETMDGYGFSGFSAAFTPCVQAGICRMCPFRTVCPEFLRSNWQ